MLALVVGLALAITLAWWVQSRRVPPPGSPTPPVAAPTSAASSVVTPLWDVTPATVHLPLSSPGESAEPDAGEPEPRQELQAALGPYEKGDYPRAIPLLEAYVSRYPDAADALLYLGVSYLLTGRPADALGPLGHAADLKTPAGRREADWFLAAAEQRAGQVEESRRRLDRLCRAPGAYQASACAARDALR